MALMHLYVDLSLCFKKDLELRGKEKKTFGSGCKERMLSAKFRNTIGLSSRSFSKLF